MRRTTYIWLGFRITLTPLTRRIYKEGSGRLLRRNVSYIAQYFTPFGGGSEQVNKTRKERCTLARAGCVRARTAGSACEKPFTPVRVLVLNPENISLACSYVFWFRRGQNEQRTHELLKIRLSHQTSCKHNPRSMLGISNIKSIAIIHHTSCICITQSIFIPHLAYLIGNLIF